MSTARQHAHPPVWQCVHAPIGGTVTALALGPNDGNDQLALAGTLVGLFRSTDGGVSWTPVHQGLRSPFVRCLALSPTVTVDGIAAAGTSESGFHLSYDRGLTWQRHEFWSSHPSINAIAFSPAFSTDGTIFTATTNQGVYMSRSRGRSWSAADNGLPQDEITTLALSPQFAANAMIVAGVSGHGIWKSESGGKAWVKMDGPDTSSDVIALAFAPSDPDGTTIVAAYETDGLFSSANGGSTWAAAADDLSGDGVNDMVAVGGSTGTVQIIAVQADGSIIAAEDPIGPWHMLRPADQEDDLLTIAAWADDDDMQIITGGYLGGVLRTSAPGSEWTPSNDGLVAHPILSQAVQPDGPSIVVGTAAGDILCTVDAGATWATGTTGLPGEPVTAMAISPAFTDDGFGTAVVGSHARHTTNRGQTWQAFASLPSDAAIMSTAISPASGTNLVTALGGPGGTLLLSDDNGAAWTRLNETFFGATIAAIAFSPRFPKDGVILAAAIAHNASIVYRSADRGQSWEPYVQADSVFPWISLAIPMGASADDDDFAFATGSEVYFPSPGPKNFRNVAYVVGPDAAVRDLLSIRTLDGETCYIAATSAGIFRSNVPNHGWQEISGPLSGRPIQAIDAIAADDNYTLVATTINGEIWTSYLNMATISARA